MNMFMYYFKVKVNLKSSQGNSLVVQWVGLCTFAVEGLCLIPGGGPKILQVAQCSQKLLKIKK